LPRDAVTYVINYGRPDLFIAFTCNSAWTEIKVELLVGQSPTERHDLTGRVFRQKLIKLMDVSYLSGPFICYRIPSNVWYFS
jgi:hypothetical protein